MEKYSYSLLTFCSLSQTKLETGLNYRKRGTGKCEYLNAIEIQGNRSEGLLNLQILKNVLLFCPDWSAEISIKLEMELSGV